MVAERARGERERECVCVCDTNNDTRMYQLGRPRSFVCLLRSFGAVLSRLVTPMVRPWVVRDGS
jgi:hypothetical protein